MRWGSIAGAQFGSAASGAGIGKGEVVGVEPSDEFRLAPRETCIARVDDPAVRLRDDPYPPVAGSQLSKNARRLVGRAVIDDDDADLAQGL
jgi:hypothetical protein